MQRGQNVETQIHECITHAHAQTGSMTLKQVFAFTGSITKNGSMKWPKIKAILIHHHEPFSRMRYQKVSSGMFAFQTTKYCANSV